MKRKDRESQEDECSRGAANAELLLLSVDGTSQQISILTKQQRRSESPKPTSRAGGDEVEMRGEEEQESVAMDSHTCWLEMEIGG